MRLTVLLTLICPMALLLNTSEVNAESFECGKPDGVMFTSLEPGKSIKDDLPANKVRVIANEAGMAFAGHDVPLIQIHRTPGTITSVAKVSDALGDSVMLYTLDTKRGWLYISSHKDMVVFDATRAGTYVSKCTRS